MLRVIAALRRVDADDIVTPEGWRPGDDVLLPPDIHQDAILASEGGLGWFHRVAPGAV
jgi:peroxiredoxin (alkyl hydroperoxide reductase subunit C)